MAMGMIVFAYPGLFLLLLLLPLLVAWYLLKQKTFHTHLQVPNIKAFGIYRRTLRQRLVNLPFILRLMVLVLLITILARPQSVNKWQSTVTDGIDIIIALDVSGSMLAMDFKPDRLEAAKDIAIEFISGRQTDRIGLVLFSGESFTQCPLTTDRARLTNLFREVRSGMIEDGTAIGVGLANAVARLKESKAKSRVVILLTDGENNMGAIEPITASELAKSFDIRVYTIGVGTRGMARFPVGKHPFTGQMMYQDMKVEIDEPLLNKMAAMTGGQYFRATDNQALRDIYATIDQLEKSEIDVQHFSSKKEEYLPFALVALGLLLLEVLIRLLVLRTLP